MVWYAIALIVACVVSSLIHVAAIGRSITFTPSSAVCSIIVSALEIWAIVSLAS